MFYTYSQNNSGGVFCEPAKYVIVEANSSREADSLAELYCDVYFNGCMIGLDCSCCGDRWNTCWEDGTDQPEIYGSSAIDFKEDYGCSDRGIPTVMIRYLDGTKSVDPKSITMIEPKRLTHED